MTNYNLILILNPSETDVLMCKRMKDPYEGKFNLVGGKIEDGEDLLLSAYRELFEETGISRIDVTLQPFIDFIWHPADMTMHVFIGRLNHEVELEEEVHPLHWIPVASNFFDTNTYAGEGNIGHMMAIYQLHRRVMFDD